MESLEFDEEFSSVLTEYSLLTTSLRRTRRSDCLAATNGCAADNNNTMDSSSSSSTSGLAGLCASAFWDADLSWPRDDFPDFTNCFLRSVPIWIPVAILWLWTPLHVRGLQRLEAGYIPMSLVHLSKLTAWAFLLLTQLADLLFSVFLHVNENPVAGIDFMAPIVLLLTYTLVGLVIHMERTRGCRSSIPLFTFFLFHLIFFLPSLQHNIRYLIHPHHLELFLPRVVFFLVNFLFVFIQLVSLCFVEPPSFFAKKREPRPEDLISPDMENNAPCPEKFSSPSSYITFWWLTGLIWKGFKNPLELKDVWLLKSDLRSARTNREFSYWWDREMGKEEEASSLAVDEKSSEGRNGVVALKSNGMKLGSRKGGDITAEETPFRSNENDDSDEDADADDVKIVKADPRLTRDPSFLRALIFAFWRPFALSAFFNLIALTFQLLSPVALSRLIGFAAKLGSSLEEPLWKGYFYALCLFLLEVGRAMIHQHHFYFCYVLGIKLRTAIMTAVYMKSLRLTSLAKQASTIGEITNLMSVDAQKFMEITGTLNLLWSAPLMIFIAIAMLWGHIGPSAMAGLAVMIALIPFNIVVGSVSRKMQNQNMKFKDARIKMMTEVLNGMKVLKLYAWEPSFMKKLMAIREEEMVVLRKSLYLFSAVHFSFSCAPVFVAVAAFASFILSDPENNILTAEKAFVSLSLFNIIRFPMNMLPHMITFLVQITVSIKRIAGFLKRDEIPEGRISRHLPAGVSVRVRKAKFSWKKEGKPTLSGINFDVASGSLTAVVGSVGSGKSSLISAILGEMEIPKGEICVEESVAYVSQQAWMQNATLKDNIIFGKETASKSYEEVIAACALEPDLKVLPGGDKTEIGEKGINLSGGQKQRISLARAVYQDASLYLLDDPLSAVDSHVGKHIFEKVIGPNGLLQKKTRVLVTNAITYLSHADQIIVLKDGEISEIGTYQQLIDHNGAFADFMETHLAKESGDMDEEEEEEEVFEEEEEGEKTVAEDGPGVVGESASPPDAHQSRRRSSVKSSSTSPRKNSQKPAAAAVTAAKQAKDAKQTKEAKLITEEGVAKGSVKSDVMLTYLRSVGWFFALLTLVMFLAQNGFMFYSSLWLKDWADGSLPKERDFLDDLPVNSTLANATSSIDSTLNTTEPSKIETTSPAFSSQVYLGVYALLGLAQACTILISSLAIAIGCTRACISLHSSMLRNILASPMSFFDTVPLGRILNRFSKDIDSVDLQLPNNMRFVLMTASRVITTLITIAYVTPTFLLIVPVLGILYFFIQRIYVATTRQLKRMDSASKSPIFSFFGESLQGTPTIRAFGRRGAFEREILHRLDKNLMFFFPSTVADRWVGLRLEFVGSLVVLFASILAIHSKGITAGAVGLSITYAMQVTQTLNFMVRMATEFETNVVSVERIKEYSETPTEAAWNAEDASDAGNDEKTALVPKLSKPSSDWPNRGKVEFAGYSLRYRAGLDLVLKNISLVVESGEKVGIVGRTGAGKSSLTMALFRIIEPAAGKILIDDLDISGMGLHDLRKKISIIPQDPVLFSGTLRLNLDPFEMASDDQLWEVLELTQLKEFVSGMPETLDFLCTEGGDNLSVGQRQLVCLARALLRKSRILVLDEATAAIDLETDAFLQTTIRREFADSTIVTIAHRLNTIMDYDKILVLDQGRIAEFDTPNVLLGDSQSVFYGMAKDANLV